MTPETEKLLKMYGGKETEVMLDEQQITMIRSCLVLCARRLRHYENEHIVAMNGTASLVERQIAEKEASTDDALAEMAESLILATRQPDPD